MLKIFTDISELKRSKYFSRSKLEIDKVMPHVRKIMEHVKRDGDYAVIKYTEKFDKVKLSREELIIRREQFSRYKPAPELFKALRLAAKNITVYHKQQVPKNYTVTTTKGIKVGLRWEPFDSVGIYIPSSGIAAYGSTVLMAAIPAALAGVNATYIATPPIIETKQPHKFIMEAATVCNNIQGIINASAVPAIAAFVFGTETIKAVDKIVGPGNIYVTAAKILAFQEGKSIDSPAGPSEVMVIADKTANPEYIAWDLISQAAHGSNSAVSLITDSENIATEVNKLLQTKPLPALKNYGFILLTDLDESIQFVNDYAPEHLVIMTKKPETIFKKIKNAGSVFLGEYSPVSAGDYITGTNHILPTSGYCKSFSGLTIFDFMKTIFYQQLTRQGLKRVVRDIEILSKAENLYDSHGVSAKIRLKLD